MRELRPSAMDLARSGFRRLPFVAAGAGIALIFVSLVGLATGESTTIPLVVMGGLGLVLATSLVPPTIRREGATLPPAHTDVLTGLPDHHGFRDNLGDLVEDARERGGRLALILMDLDSFQAVNDLHGHPYGDDVLRSVAVRLRNLVAATGTAARIGGKKFALVVPGCDPEQGYRLAERARNEVAAIPVPRMKLSCSAGLATFPEDGHDASTLHLLAEGALRWAKRRGKDRTRRFDPGHVQLAWTKRHAREVAELLERPDPIVPVYQPVVALASGHLVGYEALARFKGAPGRSPEAWFAQAHGCGMGAKLEAAAIRAALEPVGRPIGTHLALNVSPSALSSTDVMEALPQDLSGLVLEITEHEFVPEDDTLTAAVAALRNRGVLIALDDAGAGYAGLSQVMRMNPDIVKLDRDLTKDISTDPARRALVESFVRFARRVNAVVCAEGVESLDDLAALCDLDVEWAQGFALARPDRPWSLVSPVAAQVCRATLGEALRSPQPPDRSLSAGDRGLESLSAKLSGARSREDLEDVLELIAEELNADSVCLSRWRSETGIIETMAESYETAMDTYDVTNYPLTARVLCEQEAVQVLVGDPQADPNEVELMLTQGFRSMLLVPIVSHGETLGLVEAYSQAERPWTRMEINRARIISNQFGSVIQAMRPGESAPVD